MDDTSKNDTSEIIKMNYRDGEYFIRRLPTITEINRLRGTNGMPH